MLGLGKSAKHTIIRRERDIMMNQKLEEIMATARLNELIRKKEKDDDKKNTIVWVLAILGAIAAVAGIAFAVVKYFSPAYLEDDFDDFDDDYDDDFFDDDDVIEVKPEEK